MDQIIKGAYLSVHNATILAQENASLRRANKKKRQKRTRSNRQIALEEGISIGEGLQLAQQPEQPVENSQVPVQRVRPASYYIALPYSFVPARFRSATALPASSYCCPAYSILSLP